MDYMKISFEDIKSAEEFFENDANLANFLLNVYRFYSKTELKPKNSEVKRYLKVYEKTMKRVLIASENGKKNISKRTDNQQVNEVLLEAKSKPPLKGTQSKGTSDPISTPSDLPSTNNKVLSIKTKEKESKEKYEAFIDWFNRSMVPLKGKIGNYRIQGKSSDKVKKQFLERIKEGYQSSDFKNAIKAISKDEHHQESNYKYLTPEFLTRADKLERFSNMVIPETKSGGVSMSEMQ